MVAWTRFAQLNPEIFVFSLSTFQEFFNKTWSQMLQDGDVGRSPGCATETLKGTGKVCPNRN